MLLGTLAPPATAFFLGCEGVLFPLLEAGTAGQGSSLSAADAPELTTSGLCTADPRVSQTPCQKDG